MTGRMLGFDTWITLYISVSTAMRRSSNERNMHILCLRSVDENKQAPLLSQRPGYQEAKEKLMIVQKEKENNQLL